jgi:hypothetical protein
MSSCNIHLINSNCNNIIHLALQLLARNNVISNLVIACFFLKLMLRLLLLKCVTLILLETCQTSIRYATDMGALRIRCGCVSDTPHGVSDYFNWSN